MADGTRRNAEGLEHPNRVLVDLPELKMRTLLDSHQSGDALTGRLRIRLEPNDAQEVLLPISYRPFRDGVEVRIGVSS